MNKANYKVETSGKKSTEPRWPAEDIQVILPYTKTTMEFLQVSDRAGTYFSGVFVCPKLPEPHHTQGKGCLTMDILPQMG